MQDIGDEASYMLCTLLLSIAIRASRFDKFFSLIFAILKPTHRQLIDNDNDFVWNIQKFEHVLSSLHTTFEDIEIWDMMCIGKL